MSRWVKENHGDTSVELVNTEFEDKVKSDMDDDEISINDTCSSSIGTPPSVGQSV